MEHCFVQLAALEIVAIAVETETETGRVRIWRRVKQHRGETWSKFVVNLGGDTAVQMAFKRTH